MLQVRALQMSIFMGFSVTAFEFRYGTTGTVLDLRVRFRFGSLFRGFVFSYPSRRDDLETRIQSPRNEADASGKFL
jgi:hypothetical protein